MLKNIFKRPLKSLRNPSKNPSKDPDKNPSKIPFKILLEWLKLVLKCHQNASKDPLKILQRSVKNLSKDPWKIPLKIGFENVPKILLKIPPKSLIDPSKILLKSFKRSLNNRPKTCQHSPNRLNELIQFINKTLIGFIWLIIISNELNDSLTTIAINELNKSTKHNPPQSDPYPINIASIV